MTERDKIETAAVTEETTAPETAVVRPLGAIFFAIAALAAAIGPLDLADGVVERRDVRKAMKRHVMVSLLFLGMGTGAVIMGLLRTALK